MSVKYNRKWWVLFTACLLTVMLNIDATAVNVAIPAMAHQFHADLASMQWVINAFVLFSAMFQIIGGRSGDIYGHRNVYVIGTVIFIVASSLSGFAINAQMLIAGRALQGFALGIAYPMTMALILNAFSEKEHGLAIGVVMGTMGVSLAIGPTIGGFILHYMSWRWIFFINLPVGLLTVLCTYLFCPKDVIGKQSNMKLDLKGGLFLCLGMLGIILALNQSQVWGVQSPAFIVTFLLGVLFIITLYYVERNKASKLIDFNLFKNLHFSVNSIIRVIAQMVFLPVLFFIPIYLQNIMLISAVKTGLILVVCTLFVGLVSPIAGKLVDRYGFRAPNVFSMIFISIGCFIFSCLPVKLNLAMLFVALAITGIGVGINFVSSTSGALSQISKTESGVASGVFFTIIWASCALGIAFFGSVLTHYADNKLSAAISSFKFLMTSSQHATLERVTHGLSPVSIVHAAFGNIATPKMIDIVQSAYLHGFRMAFFLLAILSAIGILMAFPSNRQKK